MAQGGRDQVRLPDPGLADDQDAPSGLQVGAHLRGERSGDARTVRPRAGGSR